MDDICNRIRILRESLHMTRAAFGKPVGATDSVIKNIEYGKTTPRDLLIDMICNAYSVSEKWLRTGEGDMLLTKTSEAELIAAFGELINLDDTDFKRKFISALARLDGPAWIAIEKFCREVVSGETKKDGD